MKDLFFVLCFGITLVVKGQLSLVFKSHKDSLKAVLVLNKDSTFSYRGDDRMNLPYCGNETKLESRRRKREEKKGGTLYTAKAEGKYKVVGDSVYLISTPKAIPAIGKDVSFLGDKYNTNKVKEKSFYTNSIEVIWDEYGNCKIDSININYRLSKNHCTDDVALVLVEDTIINKSLFSLKELEGIETAKFIGVSFRGIVAWETEPFIIDKRYCELNMFYELPKEKPWCNMFFFELDEVININDNIIELYKGEVLFKE